MTDSIALDVRGLGKRYKRGARQSYRANWRTFLLHKLKRLVGVVPKEASTEFFWALRDASFRINRGENVGIIGLNGAGKSTLLKLLSRITEPTEGQARVTGRVGALLEVGTGFHPELTGRENVFLYGSILGMTKDEVAAKLSSIIEFSEIGEFIETPVKRYSSGMYVRLAFAVAAHLEPEILFLDEVLAVGDLSFQRKCLDYAKRLQQRDSTILFVSHNMFSIKSMCDRVIYIRKGKVAFDGPVQEGIAIYEKDCRFTASGLKTGEEPSDWPIYVTEGYVTDASGTPATVFDMGDRIALRFKYKCKEPLQDPNFIVSIVRSDGVVCATYSTEVDGVATGNICGEGKVELRLSPTQLVAEVYSIIVGVRRPGFRTLLCEQNIVTMHIRHELLNSHFGVFHERAEWDVS